MAMVHFVPCTSAKASATRGRDVSQTLGATPSPEGTAETPRPPIHWWAINPKYIFHHNQLHILLTIPKILIHSFV